MTGNIDLVRAFCEAFSRRNSDELLQFFTEDAVYHNMPMPPVRGKDAIRSVLDLFLKPSQSVQFIILRIAASDGAVLTERLDRFVMSGKEVDLPVSGIFELEGGKIVAWRDYFDMATWTRQTSPS